MRGLGAVARPSSRGRILLLHRRADEHRVGEERQQPPPDVAEVRISGESDHSSPPHGLRPEIGRAGQPLGHLPRVPRAGRTARPDGDRQGTEPRAERPPLARAVRARDSSRGCAPGPSHRARAGRRTNRRRPALLYIKPEKHPHDGRRFTRDPRLHGARAGGSGSGRGLPLRSLFVGGHGLRDPDRTPSLRRADHVSRARHRPSHPERAAHHRYRSGPP